jgi:hypothetical protein
MLGERDPSDRRLIFIDPLLDKARVQMGPIFDPIKQSSRILYSKYSGHELKFILDFITNCNKMTQEMTYQLKMKRSAK